MNNAVGKIIQQKRRLKNMTQEQLAQLVGVSSAAVSKWETASALPDVALLCPLARALNCTVDELLDFKAELTAEEIEVQMKSVRDLFEKNQWKQAIEFCEARLKEYPNDLHLVFRIASIYASYLGVSGSEEVAQKQLQDAIKLMERAIHIDDETLRRTALNELAALYTMNHQLDEALQTLDQLPGCNQEAWTMRANILFRKGELDQAEQLDTANLFSHIREAQVILLSLANIAEKRQDNQRAFFMLDAVEQLGEQFELKGVANGISQMAIIQKAKLFCEQKNWKLAVKQIQNYVTAVLQSIEQPPMSNYFKTAMQKETSPISTEFRLKNAVNVLESFGFPEEITSTPQYQAAYQELYKVAYPDE